MAKYRSTSSNIFNKNNVKSNFLKYVKTMHYLLREREKEEKRKIYLV